MTEVFTLSHHAEDSLEVSTTFFLKRSLMYTSLFNKTKCIVTLAIDVMHQLNLECDDLCSKHLYLQFCFITWDLSIKMILKCNKDAIFNRKSMQPTPLRSYLLVRSCTEDSLMIEILNATQSSVDDEIWMSWDLKDLHSYFTPFQLLIQYSRILCSTMLKSYRKSI